MKRSFKDYILFAGPILGTIALVISSFVLAKETIISWQFLLFIWLFVGVLSSFIWLWRSKHQIKFKEFLGHALLFSISIGSISLLSLLLTNKYIKAEKPTKNYKVEILNRGTEKGKYGRHHSFVDINVHGIEKKLIFKPNGNLYDFKFISLTTRNGFLGFEIIKDFRLTN